MIIFFYLFSTVFPKMTLKMTLKTKNMHAHLQQGAPQHKAFLS